MRSAIRRAAALAGLWVLVVGASAFQQAPAANGLIVGRVLDAKTNAPVPGVLVSLLQMRGVIANTQPVAEPRVITDAQGRFMFRGVPTGEYLIQAAIAGTDSYTLNGFVISGFGFPSGAYLNGGFGQRRPNGQLQLLELTENERLTDVVIRMWKSVAISGRVTDEIGEPLVDQVVAAAQVSSDGRLISGPSVRTDDRGVYRIAALTPGQYIVVVPQTQVSVPLSIGEEAAAGPADPTQALRFTQAGAPPPRAGGLRVGSSAVSTIPDPGRFGGDTLGSNALAPIRDGESVLVYPTTFFPSTTRLAQSTRINLDAGDRTDVDIQLRPLRSAEVSGMVVDEAGPMPNIGVHLMPADNGDDASILETATTVSDSRGRFSFAAVPSGQYTIVVWRTGPAQTASATQPATGASRIGETSRAWARQSVAVAGKTIQNLTVTLHAPVNVIGRVVFEGAAEKPTADRLRQPVTIAPVIPLFRTPGPAPGNVIDVANDGRLNIKGVSPPGRFMLSLPGIPSPWTLQSITVGGRDVTDAPIEIADVDIDDLVIKYSDRAASLAGVVTIPPGADNDAAVFLFPVNKARWQDARLSTRMFRTARVTRKGAFNMTALIPGDYLVVAVSDAVAAAWPDESFLKNLGTVASAIHIDAGQAATVSLKLSVLK